MSIPIPPRPINAMLGFIWADGMAASDIGVTGSGLPCFGDREKNARIL